MIELLGRYTSGKIFAKTIEQEVTAQVLRVLNHPIFKDCKIRLMPDCHVGKGCTIGFTSTLPINGEIIPNIVGVDQSCTISAYKIDGKDLDNYAKLDKVIRQHVPFGTGGKRKNVHKDIPERLIDDVNKLCKDFLKSNPIDDLLKIGSLGGGNHFISIEEGKTGTYLLIHSGSRNFGNNLARYFQNIAINKNCYLSGIYKELSYLDGKDAQDYLVCADICKQYSKVNHIVMAKEIFEKMQWNYSEIIMTHHNYIDLDDQIIRKGAIRLDQAQLGLIPINMAYGTYLVEGKGNFDWNNSGPHGAGRLFSRSQAKCCLSMEQYKESMKDVYSTCVSTKTLDESPMAYKPGEEIEQLIKDTCLIVDHLVPKYNFKAE